MWQFYFYTAWQLKQCSAVSFCIDFYIYLCLVDCIHIVPEHMFQQNEIQYIGININWLWQGILLGKRYGKSNCLLLAETGSSGWLLRVIVWKHEQSSGSSATDHNFKKPGNTKMPEVNTKHSRRFTVFDHCHFGHCQLGSVSAAEWRFRSSPSWS